MSDDTPITRGQVKKVGLGFGLGCVGIVVLLGIGYALLSWFACGMLPTGCH